MEKLYRPSDVLASLLFRYKNVVQHSCIMISMSSPTITPTPLPSLLTHAQELVSSRIAPTVELSSIAAQLWLDQWAQAAYAKTTLPPLPLEYGIPASAAAVALTELFDANVQALVAQYPQEHRKNQLIPIFVLARALGAWQESFVPSPSDWLNLRTNLGYYQQKYGLQWRGQFEGGRPNALEWLKRIPEAVGQELTDAQNLRIFKSLKESQNAEPRFWRMVLQLWDKLSCENNPTSLQDNLNLCASSISMGLQAQQAMRDIPSCLDIDTFPPFVHNMAPLDLAVPSRDYQKGWDHCVRVNGRTFALEQARTHYPLGIPDTPDDRVEHLKLVDTYYQQFERSFEPWRWDGLEQGTAEEQAQAWAWLTSWASEYHWDTFVKEVGIHPPVEAVGREYTGQSTQWWLTAPYNDKVEAAKTWIESASHEMADARKEHCNIDTFIGDMFNKAP